MYNVVGNGTSLKDMNSKILLEPPSKSIKIAGDRLIHLESRQTYQMPF